MSDEMLAMVGQPVVYVDEAGGERPALVCAAAKELKKGTARGEVVLTLLMVSTDVTEVNEGGQRGVRVLRQVPPAEGSNPGWRPFEEAAGLAAVES